MRLEVIYVITQCFHDNIGQKLRVLNHLLRTHDRNDRYGLYALQIARWRMRVLEIAMGNFDLWLLIEQREMCNLVL